MKLKKRWIEMKLKKRIIRQNPLKMTDLRRKNAVKAHIQPPNARRFKTGSSSMKLQVVSACAEKIFDLDM